MLDEMFIRKIAREVMAKHAAENGGRNGMTRLEVIEAVIAMNGDLDDVRAVMAEGVRQLMPGRVELS